MKIFVLFANFLKRVILFEIPNTNGVRLRMLVDSFNQLSGLYAIVTTAHFFFHSPGRRPPMKCLPISHQHFQSPRASGRPINAHPTHSIREDLLYFKMEYFNVFSENVIFRNSVEFWPHTRCILHFITHTSNFR